MTVSDPLVPGGTPCECSLKIHKQGSASVVQGYSVGHRTSLPAAPYPVSSLWVAALPYILSWRGETESRVDNGICTLRH